MLQKEKGMVEVICRWMGFKKLKRRRNVEEFVFQKMNI